MREDRPEQATESSPVADSPQPGPVQHGAADRDELDLLLDPHNGVGTAASLCGVFGVVLGTPLILFPVAFVLGVAGIILGIFGRRRVERRIASNRGQATLGVVLGMIAAIEGLAGFVVAAHSMSAGGS